MKMREFTKHDWYGYSGAESPEDSEPIISAEDVTVDGYEADVVVDKVGITVNFWPLNDTRYYFCFGKDATFTAGKALAACLQSRLSTEGLKAMGFSSYGDVS